MAVCRLALYMQKKIQSNLKSLLILKNYRQEVNMLNSLTNYIKIPSFVASLHKEFRAHISETYKKNLIY